MNLYDKKAIDLAGALHDLEEEAFLAKPPDRKPKEPNRKSWRPVAGPVGLEILRNRTSRVKFAYGERGSTKTAIFNDDLILHCYQDFDPAKLFPLAVMCTIVRSAATEGGAWDKINTLHRKAWFDNLGVEFTEPKMDDQKNRYIFIGNKAEGWSRVVLKSIPYGASIRGRFKGIEPSYFFMDEITETDDPDYFLIPSQSLRRPTGGTKQFAAAGNPPILGTDHWTWKVIVEGAALEKDKDGAPIIHLPEGGGRLGGLKPETAVYHVPLSDNMFWSDEEKADYRETLMAEAVLDPTAEDRIIKGLWVAKPSGVGLFKEFYIPSIHTKGDARKRQGLQPLPGFPMVLGYDLGQTNSSCTFEQLIPTRNKSLWLIFDEVDHIGEKIIYKSMAWEIIERIKFWNKVVGTNFMSIHVTDDSAVNQWRPGGSGSYDAWEFEKEFNRVSEKKIKMLPAPKGSGSVDMRVRMLQTKLYAEEIVVSAMCVNSINMLSSLENKKDDPNVPKRGKWLHKFDSLTYPMSRFEIRQAKTAARPEPESPRLTFAGEGA